ncbi:MAG: DEAD/DEAH box helicase [Kiloniellaceae bacterium]
MSGSARQVASRVRRMLDRPPSFLGWHSTDEQEITRRRWRGRSEVEAVEPVDPADPFYGLYRVRSASGGTYEVEIRALSARENSCGCHDHAVNGLGTCKHIEGTLYALRRGRARPFDAAARQGSPWAEVYLSRREEPSVRVMWPADADLAARLREHLGAFFSDEGGLNGDPLMALPALKQAVAALPPPLARHVRVSRHLDAWSEDQRRRQARTAERERFLAEMAGGGAGLEVLRYPLLPYQRDGMLHLAFAERALLADEMGLGKTVQAIAACELLRRRRGVERVLVVGPTSLKAEWQEQIARFTTLPTRIIEGDRAARLDLYRQPAFFNLANYEQVIPDGPEINRLLKPDVVILDEAQRIKNWQTKTARAVKGLKSPYAFVLTGTPLENRIDEVYSIVQYLDPGLLGPLFRFNRTFYELDARGRPVGYRSLDELHRRLQPVMLRRRKDDVEDQLPQRTVGTRLVTMEAEQRLRYEEYEARVARLVHIARRRPLTREEFERLQRWLACMRMLCDTPYILDPECRLCPKLEELEPVLADLLAQPDCKVIVFSEWVRMLELVGELAREMDLDVAWHTGSVPQKRRRAEIRRFKEDPTCRVFLSSDSGSVGLNLQAANVVINLDLPWNPAKLEQRIARAWRKHQSRPVRVINLVTEDSIEQRMLDVLTRKQDLADGVLDGMGDLSALQMPSGRAAFLERLDAVMGGPTGEGPVLERVAFCAERLRADLLARHGDALLLLEIRRDAAGARTVLAVIDAAPGADAREAKHLAQVHGGEADGDAPRFEVLDRAGYTALRRLIDTGILRFAEEEACRLHEAPGLADAAQPTPAENGAPVEAAT